MSSLVRSWMALGVLAFVANAAVRPAVARAGNDAPPAPPPAGAYAPAPYPQSPAPPPAGAAPQPAPYPTAPYGTYPGYAPAPQYPPYAAYPGYPQPQLTKVHRPRRGLVTGGAITFGVTWGIAASISLLLNDSCSGCTDSSDYLWIPIAGPLVVAARENSSGDGFFLLWSAAQAAGAAMLIVGLVGHDVMEYRYARSGATLQLTPLLARNTSGMALTARW